MACSYDLMISCIARHQQSMTQISHTHNLVMITVQVMTTGYISISKLISFPLTLAALMVADPEPGAAHLIVYHPHSCPMAQTAYSSASTPAW